MKIVEHLTCKPTAIFIMEITVTVAFDPLNENKGE